MYLDIWYTEIKGFIKAEIEISDLRGDPEAKVKPVYDSESFYCSMDDIYRKVRDLFTGYNIKKYTVRKADCIDKKRITCMLDVE